MSAESRPANDRAAHFDSIILSYLEAADAGQTPPAAEFAARYPEYATELAAFFADQAVLDPLVAPLRDMARASGTAAAVSADTDGETTLSTGPFPDDDDPPLPPTDAPVNIPGYEIRSELGRGGMGVVYKAWQRSLKRFVAIKMLRKLRAAGASVVDRFRAEAEIVALFDHPNIVRVHDRSEHAGRPFLVLEYVAGGSLADRPRGERWQPRAAAALVADLADAVNYAHRQGVIHRDLKPANILLTRDGVPKVTDFGLSKLIQSDAAWQTQSGDKLGTPAYMAPEQADGRCQAAGPTADVFGLGAVLYDLLTGEPPFAGATVAEVMENARAGRVRPPRELNPQVPAALERICLRATAADPERRYPSAADLGADLRRYLRRSRRRTGLVLAGCVLAFLLVAAAAAAPFLPRPGDNNMSVPRPATSPPAVAATVPEPVVAPPVVPPVNVAQKAHEILEKNCYRCHGKDGSVEGGFNYVLDHSQLVTRRRMLVPSKPDESKLWRRIKSGEMPPEDEKPRPSDEDVAVLRRWIAEGAADFTDGPTRRDFIAPADVVQAIHDDLQTAAATDRPFRRYFIITHLHNAGLPEDGLQTYRFALSKLVNSLSWQPKVVVPVAVDKARTVFRIDLRDYKWNERVWQRVLAAYPYGVVYDSDKAKFIGDETHCPLPYVRADWFVFEASRPPLYHEVLQLPGTAAALEAQLRVDVAEDLRTLQAARAGFNGSGVARYNRLLERHESIHGAYWKSYDFAAPTGADAELRDLFQHPLGPAPEPNAFRHAGGEIIFNLPNHLQGYMLVNAAGKRIDQGPIEIVKDSRHEGDGTVVNGISCMACHARGIILKDDQVREKLDGSPRAFPKDDADRIRGLYLPRDKFRQLQQDDAKRFADAVAKTGVHLSATDPIVALAARYEWELDLKLAAAEAGVQADDLARKLDDRNVGAFSKELVRVFGQLKGESGTVQRQVFADHFADVVRELQPAGAFVKPAPPDRFVNTFGMELTRVEPGTFQMGSPKDEPNRGADEPVHPVEITKPYRIGIYPVTQEEYHKVMGGNPEDLHFTAGGKSAAKVRGLDTSSFPVEGVTWKDAQKFCEKLSAKEGRTYRLPTEAEWEYACRAGTQTAYSFGDDAKELDHHAWHAGNSGGRPHPVGQKEPNAWGLYDLHGNVREYCADRYDAVYYEHSPRRDPHGPDAARSPFIVLRGGGWDGKAADARSAARTSTAPQVTYDNTGFRIVLEIGDKEGKTP